MTTMTKMAPQNHSHKNDTYKVLSIDLDYICEPYIELYSDLPNQILVDKQWDVVFSQNKYGSNNFDINPDNLLFCIDAFSRALMNCSNVAFGMTHDTILYELEGKNNIDLFNIDHHHDVAYSDEAEHELVQWDIVYENNWVEYLNIHDRLASYVWIKNENSEDIMCQYKEMNQGYWYLKNDVPAPIFNDLIFVCLSPTYTPKFHWFYFRIFINLFKAFYPDQKIRMHDKRYKNNPMNNPMRGNEEFLADLT